MSSFFQKVLLLLEMIKFKLKAGRKTTSVCDAFGLIFRPLRPAG